MSELKTLYKEGLWGNNPALVQLLGLCPLLAVTSTITNALGLGLATLLVLVGSNITVSIVRNWVPKDIRIPVFVMIIAGFVTIVQLLMNAYTFGLYQSLGIFIPLIVTNCAIIGRAEAFVDELRLYVGSGCTWRYARADWPRHLIRWRRFITRSLGFSFTHRSI